MMMLLSHGTTMGSDTSYDLAYQLISDILSQQDILLSVNTHCLLVTLYLSNKGLDCETCILVPPPSSFLLLFFEGL